MADARLQRPAGDTVAPDVTACADPQGLNHRKPDDALQCPTVRLPLLFNTTTGEAGSRLPPKATIYRNEQGTTAYEQPPGAISGRTDSARAAKPGLPHHPRQHPADRLPADRCLLG